MAHCRKRQLTVFINNTCNLCCRYCYEGARTCFDKKNLTIDLDFVKRGISDYFASCSSRQIRFFSNGEPTIALDLIKNIRNFALELDKSCTFELQTNGFFSKNTADWISENIDIVWISCDGPAEIQNYYRPTAVGEPSSAVVEKNIAYLATKPITLGCRATIGKKNVNKQIQMIKYFAKLGVKAVMSDPLFAPVDSCNLEFSKTEAPSLMDFAVNFLKAHKYAERMGIFYGSILSANFDEEVEYACRACAPHPHLTIDGYVSACDMASSGNDTKMSALIYGKYDKSTKSIIYNKDAIGVLQSRKASNMEKCKNCEFLKNCAGACLGEALNETGSIFGVNPATCNAIRYLAKRMPLNKGLYPYLHP